MCTFPGRIGIQNFLAPQGPLIVPFRTCVHMDMDKDIEDNNNKNNDNKDNDNKNNDNEYSDNKDNDNVDNDNEDKANKNNNNDMDMDIRCNLHLSTIPVSHIPHADLASPIWFCFK